MAAGQTKQQTLEEILKENTITEKHLSPFVEEKYSLSDVVPYVRPWPRDPNAEPSGPEKDFIAYFKKEGIKYEREYALVLDEDGEIHVRYADFYLPEYDLYLEYNGMESRPEDAKRYADKKKSYERNNIPFAEIHKKEYESGKWKERLEEILAAAEKGELASASHSPSRPWYVAAAASLLMGLFFL